MEATLNSEALKIKLKKWQRVYVNRSLNLGSISAIGFDMDHTLAMYQRENFETLAFKKTLEKFLAHGYPEELHALRFDPQSVIRGLLVDRERGNLLKVDGHKYVKLAFHGKQPLEKEERHRIYNAQSFKADKFVSVDSFFALSEVHLFVEIVDYMRKNPGKIQKSFAEVYDDLRKFIDESHRDGSIKNEVLAHPERYLNVDKHLPETLIKLKESGKALFIITNSDLAYTDVLMSYLLNDKSPEHPHWRDYFDYIIVSAGKPGFFTGTRYFIDITDNPKNFLAFEGQLQRGRIYLGGSAELFQKRTGLRGDEILYVGDHIYGDIIRSKGLFNWRTMLVVEELDAELPKLEKFKDITESITTHLQIREAIDEDLHILRNKIKNTDLQSERAQERGDKKRAQVLLKNREKLVEKEEQLVASLRESELNLKGLLNERDQHIHPVWGELMKVGLDKSRFAQQVEQYACLYSSRITNLRYYSPFKRFISPHEVLPHDL